MTEIAPGQVDLFDRIGNLLTEAGYADFHRFKKDGETGVRILADVRGSIERSLLLTVYAATLRACGLTVQRYDEYLYAVGA